MVLSEQGRSLDDSQQQQPGPLRSAQYRLLARLVLPLQQRAAAEQQQATAPRGLR